MIAFQCFLMAFMTQNETFYFHNLRLRGPTKRSDIMYYAENKIVLKRIK